MKAMVIDAYGTTDAFQERELASTPLAAGEVRIAVHAASINPVDTKVRSGDAPLNAGFPVVLGCDMSGVVSEVGPGGSRFAVGDAVYGCVGGVGAHAGTYASEVVADARLLARKPASLSHREAAAMPLVTLTVAEGLDDKARVKPGDTVLVMGGTGGVGHIAVQWAAARGAIVHTTASSPEKAAMAKAFGATEVHNHREVAADGWAALAPGGAGYDIVFDTVGGPNLENSMKAARLRGHVVTTVSMGSYDLTQVHMGALTLSTVFMLVPLLHGVGLAEHGLALEKAAELVEKRRLRPLVDPTRFTLAQVGAAHALVESGRALGKVVIEAV